MASYNFRPLGSNIFLLEFENRYDLAMHFIRVQEYHESPNEEFKGKKFNMWDYVEWYSKEHGNKFTYPVDWTGFNIPGHAMREVYGNRTAPLPGHNKYDEFMRGLFEFINRQVQGSEFYLIGSKVGDSETLSHEIAHGLWYTSLQYMNAQRKNMENLIIADCTLHNRLYHNIEDMGYAESSVVDEIQAYMSTGFVTGVTKGTNKTKLNKWAKIFRKTYEEYAGDICQIE